MPTFYDSIEITHDRALAKFRARAERGNVFIAFVQTLLEGLLALLLLRWAYRRVRGSLIRPSSSGAGQMRG